MSQYLISRFTSQCDLSIENETDSDQIRSNNLPPEIVEKILRLLNYMDICQAQLICKRWKEIIHRGKLMKKASGKKGMLQKKYTGLNIGYKNKINNNYPILTKYLPNLLSHGIF